MYKHQIEMKGIKIRVLIYHIGPDTIVIIYLTG